MNVAEIKALHGDRIMPMLNNLLEVGRWMNRVEERLIREGKLAIGPQGEYIWTEKSKNFRGLVKTPVES